MDRQPAAGAVVIDKTQLLELVHEMTDPRRVVPTIYAKCSRLTLGRTLSARRSLPKLASNKRLRARRFSLELKSRSTRSFPMLSTQSLACSVHSS
jgi:hypothetical protein